MRATGRAALLLIALLFAVPAVPAVAQVSVAPPPLAQAAPTPPAPAPSGATDPGAPVMLDPVVVTVTRMEQRASEAPASVTVLTPTDIRQSASVTVDDLLRQVPGFSLFRRSSSAVAHPTAQGVSLRGIGPSGTSRALVLLDGVPLNDAFGGWVYWNAIPLPSIERVEVVRGQGSSVWGNYALSGVVQVVTRPPAERRATLEASYGIRQTTNVYGGASEARPPWRVGLEGGYFDTEGYPVVKASQQGPIDIDADSRHWLVNGRAEFVPSPDLSLFLGARYYDEDRGNGTPLQVNDTKLGLFSGGGRVRTGDGSEWSLTLFGSVQHFFSTFSTQAPDRRSETLALRQDVPSSSAGGALQWSRPLGDHLLLAGADLRWIRGETDEDVFGAAGFVRNRVTGGEQVVAGIFVQDVWRPHPRLELVGGLRLDAWFSHDGFRRDTPPPAGVPARQTFDDADAVALSPRLAALLRLTPTTDLRASYYQGFRVPTLNEQYRLFRVRNDVTAANPGLDPERLFGGEIGVQQRWGPLEGRVTGYWNDVHDLVANVTLASPLPDCPAGTICRQRQNLDLARIRGVEVELEARLGHWRFLTSYLFSDARVVKAPPQPALEGKRLAQVPENSVTVGVRWEHPRWLDVALTGRFVGNAYENDLNTLPLGSAFVVDLVLSRAVGRWGQVFLAASNLFDTTYAVGRTGDGIETIGAPRLVWGGVRLSF